MNNGMTEEEEASILTGVDALLLTIVKALAQMDTARLCAKVELSDGTWYMEIKRCPTKE